MDLHDKLSSDSPLLPHQPDFDLQQTINLLPSSSYYYYYPTYKN
jgi:hypothetical protein